MIEKEVKLLASKLLGKKSKVLVPVIGGMMNHSYIVEGEDHKRYIMYIPSESGKEMVIRSLEQDNYAIVSKLGITSQNVYFNVETGIKINEYIPGYSLDQMPLQDSDYPAIAELFNKLHKSPTLSRSDYPLFTSLEEYETTLFSLVNEVDKTYLKLRDFVFSKKEQLMKFKKALCHNDSQRSNIIKSSDNKFYFIDFEFMMNNDPIYDVAAFGNNDVDEGVKLLEHIYKNNPPYERYYLWRIYISLQWYLVALIKNKKDGLALGIDFTKVSDHFLDNALKAYNKLQKLV